MIAVSGAELRPAVPNMKIVFSNRGNLGGKS
jgi:hypothetical protein